MIDEPVCNHHYVYLRQDTKPTKRWGERLLERAVIDVFFCNKCLSYRRIPLRREKFNRESLEWREVVPASAAAKEAGG